MFLCWRFMLILCATSGRMSTAKLLPCEPSSPSGEGSLVTGQVSPIFARRPGRLYSAPRWSTKKFWAADAAVSLVSYLPPVVGIVPSAAFFTFHPRGNQLACVQLTFLVICGERGLGGDAGHSMAVGLSLGGDDGLKNRAWCDLPIEAIAVWLVVTFDTVIGYELFKLLDGQQREGTKPSADERR